MALHLNSVTLAGNLTRQPELKEFGEGKCVCNFGLAINRKYRDSAGEMQEETTFVDCEAWGKQAELICKYLDKGRNCLVEASLKFDKWQDKNGENRSKIKISVHRCHFIGSPQEKAPEEKQDDIAFLPEADAKTEAAQAQTEIKSEPVDDSDGPPF